MLNKLIRVYNEKDKYLVINPVVPAWIMTNINGVLVLKLYAQFEDANLAADEFIKHVPSTKRDSILRFITKAQDADIFYDVVGNKSHRPYSLSGIYMNMTQKCNLSCPYCFAATRQEHGAMQLSTDEYIGIINQAMLINKDLSVICTGGEPLLSPSTVPVAKYAKKYGLFTKILTNATLINEQNVEQLVESFDEFKISIDGSNATKHDYYRGSGSYDKTIHAIELLKKYKKQVTIAMVVTKENISDIDAMCENWGSMLTLQPLFPLGRGKNKEEELALTGREYFNALASNPTINPYSSVGDIVRAHINKHTILKCAIGDGEISISCTGDVYPCQLLHNDQCLIGNIRNNTLSELYYSGKMNNFKNNTVEVIEKCKSCDFRYLCGGACQARHFSETGTVHEAGDFCEYEKLGIIHGLISQCEMMTL